MLRGTLSRINGVGMKLNNQSWPTSSSQSKKVIERLSAIVSSIPSSIIPDWRFSGAYPFSLRAFFFWPGPLRDLEFWSRKRIAADRKILGLLWSMDIPESSHRAAPHWSIPPLPVFLGNQVNAKPIHSGESKYCNIVAIVNFISALAHSLIPMFQPPSSITKGDHRSSTLGLVIETAQIRWNTPYRISHLRLCWCSPILSFNLSMSLRFFSFSAACLPISLLFALIHSFFSLNSASKVAKFCFVSSGWGMKIKVISHYR